MSGHNAQQCNNLNLKVTINSSLIVYNQTCIKLSCGPFCIISEMVNVVNESINDNFMLKKMGLLSVTEITLLVNGKDLLMKAFFQFVVGQ